MWGHWEGWRHQQLAINNRGQVTNHGKLQGIIKWGGLGSFGARSTGPAGLNQHTNISHTGLGCLWEYPGLGTGHWDWVLVFQHAMLPRSARLRFALRVAPHASACACQRRRRVDTRDVAATLRDVACADDVAALLMSARAAGAARALPPGGVLRSRPAPMPAAAPCRSAQARAAAALCTRLCAMRRSVWVTRLTYILSIHCSQLLIPCGVNEWGSR